MYECERLFGIEEGMRIQELVERQSGSPCPCKRGEQCLLLPIKTPAVAEAS